MTFKQQTDNAAENLRRFNNAMNGKALAEAVAEAAEIFTDEAKRLVPERSGRMKDRITHEPYYQYRTSAGEKVYVNARYAAIVEYGHGPGEAKPTGGRQALKTDVDQYAASSRGGHAAPRPFMRPAFDRKKRDMRERIVIEIRRVKGRSSQVYRGIK